MNTCDQHAKLEKQLKKIRAKLNSCLLLLSFATALGLIQVTGINVVGCSSHNTSAAPAAVDGGTHGD